MRLFGNSKQKGLSGKLKVRSTTNMEVQSEPSDGSPGLKLEEPQRSKALNGEAKSSLGGR